MGALIDNYSAALTIMGTLSKSNNQMCLVMLLDNNL